MFVKWLPSLTLGVFLVSVANGQLANVLFEENFDGLTLQDSVNERLAFNIATRLASDPDSTPIPSVYSPDGPVGWTVDRTGFGLFDGVPSSTYSPSPTTGNVGVPGSGVEDYGVDEWEGWNFVDRDFWVDAAGQQRREEFISGSGAIAVADPDEYFDLGSPNDPTNGGYFNTSMRTPSISVSPSTLYTLSLDSSWRDEAFDDDHPSGLINANNQAVEILARFNTGETSVITGWNSDPTSATFKDDAPNERLSLGVFAPSGATSVSFEFNMANAGNDWWWAVDNLELSGAGGGGAVWSENFEGVPLGDSVNERRAFTKTTTAESTPDTQPRPDSFTHTPPTDWTIDNSGIPGGGVSRDDNGVFEFEGWTFTTQEFWTFADGQGRADFTLCQNICAIADSDEFDDLGTGNDAGPLDTLLITPRIDIAAVASGDLGMEFDSAWRAEGSQTALVTAEFFDASGNSLGTTEALRWESEAASPNFHADNTNESVLLAVDNPSDAAEVQFTFSYLNGRNNWYWGVDSIRIGSLTAPMGDFDGDGDYSCADVDALVAEIAAGSNASTFDLTGDGFVTAADLTAWLAEAGAAELASGNPYLAGDANLDGSVDVGDFNIWNSNKFTGIAAWCSGDFNADGSVDVGDFNIWNSNKFQSSDTAAVPEPQCLGILALFVVIHRCGRRRSGC